jgi:tetratricopeptide (TPR) repeat protein
MTDRASSSGPAFTWLHAVVLLAGGAVFVLLLLADKTQLKGKEQAPAAPMTAVTQPPPDTAQAVAQPPLEGSARAAELMQKAAAASAPLDTIAAAVEQMVIEGRPDLAVPLAQRLVAADSSVKNLLVLGALSRNALGQEWVKSDESAYGRFANLAITSLERAEKLTPQDEDVKIELGLSYVESRMQENSMKGIFKLREVLEINPRNAEAAYQLGLLSMDTGQFDKAEARFRSVLEIEPEFTPARYSLALCLEQLGKVQEAKDEMAKVASQQQFREMAVAASQWISDHQ